MTESATHSWLVRMGSADSLEEIARLRTDGHYTMQAVTQRTGVPPDTLRSWERRHRFPEPSRTGSNRRLYSERDVAAIAWLRDQIQHGQGTSEAIQMLLAHLRHEPEPEPRPADARPVQDPTGPIEDLVAALVDARFDAAMRAWDRLALAASIEALCTDVLLPVDRRLRHALPEGPVRSRASAFLQRKATLLLDHAGPDRAGSAVALIAEGAAILAATVLGVLLARAGLSVITPIGDLSLASLAMIRHVRPARVILVSTDEANGGGIGAFAAAVGVPLAAWSPDGWPLDLPGIRLLPTNPIDAVGAVRGGP